MIEIITISLSVITIWALLRDESPFAIVRHFVEYTLSNELLIRLTVSCPYCMVWMWGTFIEVVIWNNIPMNWNEFFTMFTNLAASVGLNYLIAKWIERAEK